MGVYIKDMKMPTSCPCELIGDGYDVYCSFAGGVPRYIKEYDECCQNGTRPSWCPLVEIPPHGRLIDADTLTVKHGWLDNFDNTHTHIQFVYANEINYTPTIIEAEEGE